MVLVPRPVHAWQPALTEDDKELVRKIAETFEIKASLSSVLQLAIKNLAEKKGVEA